MTRTQGLTTGQGVCYGAPMEDITKRPGIVKGAPSTRNGRTPEPEFEVVLVTPEMAREWLLSNTHNRPIKKRSVQIYAAAIKRGEWKLSNDAIGFDYNGVLINGQNRLQAVVEAGLPAQFLVGRNLDPETQEVMDTGNRRTLSDQLSLRGESNVHRLASVIRWAFLYDRYINTDAPMDNRYMTPTLQQLLAFHADHKSRLAIATSEGDRVRRKFPDAPAATSGVGWFIFHELNWEDCQDFFHKLGLGASLEEDNPIFVLRRWLINSGSGRTGGNENRTAHRSLKRDKPSPDMVLAVTIKAWNAYRDGKRIENLAWRAGGKRPEPFPVAR